MNDTPGWASPGSTSSEEREPGAPGPAQPGPAEPADQSPDRSGQDPQGPGTKWSKEQPPPAQWSAPAAAPGPAAPGPARPPAPGGWGTPPSGPRQGGYGGGHGAWGGGWGGPPPAARPGVIPLRPLGVGEILDGAVSTMRTYWRTVLGISLSVAVVTEIAVVLLQALALDGIATDALQDPDATPGELGRAMGDLMLDTGVVFLVSLIGTILATALLTTVTSRAVLGRQVTLGEAWRDARPQVPKLFGLIFLLLLITLGVVAAGTLPGFLLIVTAGEEAGAGLTVLGALGAGIVALWLMIRFSLASPALMLEKQGIKRALARSAKLVRGVWWRVLGVQLLATLIANVVASLVVIPFTFLAAAVSGDDASGFLAGSGDVGWTFLVVSGIGAVIGSMITFPINAGVTVLLYIDQRIRREALDLELGRAAGLGGYGSDAAPRS
ncbi:MAG TPA: hypothetical protein VFP69_15275 [Streptomyces sp.]|nr:hypothetical protein [Streptomyces sp.]